MKKPVLRLSPLLAAVLLIVLSACQPAAVETTVAPTATVSATVTATAQPSSTPVPPTPTAAAATDLPATAAPETLKNLPVLTPAPVPFDGERAYQDVLHQVSLGPRTPGSEAHQQVIEWMRSELEKNQWTVEIQETTQDGQPVRNVIAKRGEGEPWRIIGAHFDSRMKADNDPDPANHQTPVPGANDGASGVAVLMELARVLPEDTPGQVWLAFFDSEDQGRLPGWDWILGSRAMANSLEGRPEAVVIVDMIGDADQQIYYEQNSDPALNEQIWAIAAALGYEERFIPKRRFSILDDHTPFLEKGLTAIDIIDFEYPYWHTVADTPDKVSAESLEAVGSTVLHWLLR